MIFSKDLLYIFEQREIKLSDSILVKLEDGLKKDKEMLLTIDASHYGFRNGNGCVYRHDTVRNDIHTYISPSPKPIIEKHDLKRSNKYGTVIAADYMLTDFYDKFFVDHDIEGLSTSEYLELCKDHIIPFQKKNSNFNGLAFVQVTGKLDTKEGIKKVLDGEFVTVSLS